VGFRPVIATCRGRELTTGSSNCLNNIRYCIYSDMSSWWWVEIPLETSRAVWRYK